MLHNMLDRINSPADVAKLGFNELVALAGDIRNQIIDTCAANGGHLAPSLGTVDLTLALYSIFNPERDKIIWDVGHQAYTHKILTGRKDRFKTLRTKGGITGFPKMSESACDAFGVGHASTSISAAVGMAIERDMLKQNHKVIAVIGDGAFTGGEAYEGLNYAGTMGKNIIVILNDNEMSIDKNVGAMSEYLARIRIDPQYNKVKKDLQEFITQSLPFGETLWKAGDSLKDGIYAALTPGSLFEFLGYTYVGPIDGHNIPFMKEVFEKARDLEGPVLIHVRTTKGKGFDFAENEPDKFHGVGKFNRETGEMVKKPGAVPSYTEIFSQALIELAGKNPRISAITAAMPSGTGLKAFSNVYPERFFDVGIAEEHAVTFSGGLAQMGYIPVFAVYSTFLQRSYDQLIHDLAISNYHVVLCVDRAGIVGSDGETHQGIFDVPLLTSIPNTKIYSPSNYAEVCLCLNKAVKEDDCIVALRYPRGNEDPVAKTDEPSDSFYYYQRGSDYLIVTYGRLSANALTAIEILNNKGIRCDLLRLVEIYPINEKVAEIISGYDVAFFFEEVYDCGSISEKYSSVCDNVASFTIDHFIKHGECSDILNELGFSSEQMSSQIEAFINDGQD